MNLIDKNILIEEIERRYAEHDADYNNGDETELHRMVEDRAIIKYIDTLEVKEVDLEKEYKDFVEKDPVYNKLVNGIVGKAIAKHFFELGMAVSNKSQKGEKI